MTLYEKAAFTIDEPIVDKYGNKPFWAKDDGPVLIEIELKVIGLNPKPYTLHPKP